jgi:hypothetical protein
MGRTLARQQHWASPNRFRRVALGGSGAFDGLEPYESGLCLAHFLAQLIASEPRRG